jgi:hypothetical protein
MQCISTMEQDAVSGGDLHRADKGSGHQRQDNRADVQDAVPVEINQKAKSGVRGLHRLHHKIPVSLNKEYLLIEARF